MQKRLGCLFCCKGFCVFLLLWGLLGFSSRGWADSPTATTRRLIEAVRAYREEDPPEARELSLRRIEEHLAFTELARWLLGPYWQKIGVREQKRFTSLVTALLRKVAYPKAAEFLGEVRVEFEGEQLNGSEAVVGTVVVHPGEGRIRVGYRLRQVEGRWKVWDILLDGVSLATNLRSQAQSVIAKKSYRELIRRMQKKLEDD